MMALHADLPAAGNCAHLAASTMKRARHGVFNGARRRGGNRDGGGYGAESGDEDPLAVFEVSKGSPFRWILMPHSCTVVEQGQAGQPRGFC